MSVSDVLIWYQVEVDEHPMNDLLMRGARQQVSGVPFCVGIGKECCRMVKLTEKQQLFVDEYLIDLNATQAAIRAGYSAKTADVQGSRMLGNVKVQQAVAEAMAARSKRTGVNQDRIVLELAKIAFVNMTDIVDDSGRIKSTASADDLACIESVKYKSSESDTGSSEEREVKIASKLKALELLGKHTGMWNDKLDVNITTPIVISGENDLED